MIWYDIVVRDGASRPVLSVQGIKTLDAVKRWVDRLGGSKQDAWELITNGTWKINDKQTAHYKSYQVDAPVDVKKGGKK